MTLFFKVNKSKRRRGLHKNRRSDILHHFREWVWPSIGGQAFLRFIEIKVKRAKGSSHAIALGIAAGVFTSFTPFMGLHAPLAILIVAPFGGSMLMALLGTFFGNPWTFPFIWLWTYNLGNFMLGRDNPETLPKTIDFSHIISNFEQYFDAFLLPMTVGGIPTGFIFATVFYVIIYNNLNKYRNARQKLLKERRTQHIKDVASTTKRVTGKFLKGAVKKAGALSAIKHNSDKNQNIDTSKVEDEKDEN